MASTRRGVLVHAAGAASSGGAAASMLAGCRAPASGGSAAAPSPAANHTVGEISFLRLRTMSITCPLN